MQHVWAVGVILTVLVAMAIAYQMSRLGRPMAVTGTWDLPRTAGTFVTILGPLAGFSVTSAIFTANLSLARESPEFEALMAMFLFAFISCLGAAMQFGAVPNTASSDPAYLAQQRHYYLLANMGFYHGIAIAFLGLRLLLLAIGLDDLADIFTWVLLFVSLAEASRIAQFNLHMTTNSAESCLAIPFVAFACAGLYYLVATELIDGLWPDDAPLIFAIVCFISNATGFSLQQAVLLTNAKPLSLEFLNGAADKFFLVYSQAATTVVFLLWIAVAQAG
jgi:hypothetical protein